MIIFITYLFAKYYLQTLSGAKNVNYVKFPNFQEGTPNNMHFITNCRSLK